MIDLDQVKVTPRDQQVLNLLVQGCSNKEIAGQLNISPRTVKQHLRTSVPARRNPRRPQARQARYRHLYQGGGPVMMPRERLTPKEVQIATLVWARPDQPRNWKDCRHHRAGDQESSAQHLRQTRCLEPSGTRHVRGQSRRQGLAARVRAPGHALQPGDRRRLKPPPPAHSAVKGTRSRSELKRSPSRHFVPSAVRGFSSDVPAFAQVPVLESAKGFTRVSTSRGSHMP